jgi:glutamate-1-semialdehyde 2,1-aminomutase
MTRRQFTLSNRLRARGQELIPGGSHTYAKGDDQYPELAPGHVVRGKGCRVWDSDGNEYIEYGMGNRAVALGHAFEPVVEAVRAELGRGSNFARPAAIEVAAAETLLGFVPGHDMVKFSKDGSDATSAAVKIARAYTGRDMMAICADHPFFSVDDWFIGSTAMHGGIPEVVRALTVSFRYNDLDNVKALFAAHPGRIAGVILEPTRGIHPQDNFLHQLRDLAHKEGALFILDEMIAGFRIHEWGGQHMYDIVPDLATWGKALANGFSVSALTGKREFMRLGDLVQWDKPRVFLMSTTHGGETHALAAMIATLEVYKREGVIAALARSGERLRDGIQQAARARGVESHVTVSGMPANLVFATTGPDGKPSQAYRSLLIQELIQRGVLAPSLVVSYAHKDEDIDETIAAFDGAMAVYADALQDGAERFLVGAPSNPVYRTFNPRPPGA